MSSGAILVFDVPSKGSNITLAEVLEEHNESITDMASECSGSQVWQPLRVCAPQCVYYLWSVNLSIYLYIISSTLLLSLSVPLRSV